MFGHLLVDFETSILQRSDLFSIQPALVHNLIDRDRLIFYVRLGGRIKIWLRKLGSVNRLHQQIDLSFEESFVEAAVEITSDNALYRNHLQLPDNHPVRVLHSDHVMGDFQIVEPISRQFAEHFPLPRNSRGKDDVIGGYSVGEEEQEFVAVELVDVLHLATLERRGRQFVLRLAKVFLHLSTSTTILLETLCEVCVGERQNLRCQECRVCSIVQAHGTDWDSGWKLDYRED